MSYQLEESAGNLNSPLPSPVIIPHKTNEEIKKEAESSDYVGLPSFKLDNPVFNEEDPRIQNDIVLMMEQYLDTHGYHMTATTLIDEAEMKHKDTLTADQINIMKSAIQEGNWDVVKQNIKYIPKHNQKSFLYEITRQQYLELIDKHEYQLAFTVLTKNLKPLEPISRQYNNSEFSDLCYLLTCKSVRGVSSFKPWWNGVNSYRDILIDELEAMNRNDIDNNTEFVPNNRLVNLLQQAYKYQIQNSVYHPRLNVTIPSLLCDYKPFIIPNYVNYSYEQHTNNVKCVTFIGDKGNRLASGSCDKTINIYDLESNEIQTLLGHNSRIWSLDSTRNGELLVSSSGSGDIKLWNLKSPLIDCVNTYHTPSLEQNSCNNDIYCVRFNPNNAIFACGGYKKVCHVYDIETGKIIKSFSSNPSGTTTTTSSSSTATTTTNHPPPPPQQQSQQIYNYNYNTPTTSSSSSSITHISFNPYGNILVVSSKDCKIRFYDLLSGVCIMSLPGQLSEVTSIEYNMNGNLLLSSTKDSTNRIWDIRNKSVIQKFKGHQNFVSNFVKASFGMNDKIVISGSEDGIIYLWSIESGELIERLEGHKSVVYEAKWNNNKCLLASCSNDGSVKTWNYNSKKDKMKS